VPASTSRVRQRRQEDRLHDTEDGGRAADAEAERGHDHAGEAGAAADLPECVAHILRGRVNPADAVHVADVLPQHRRAAELAPRGETGFVGRHALSAIALGEQMQVRVDFEPDVRVDPPARQREGEP
jgi:hypothetical protein